MRYRQEQPYQSYPQQMPPPGGERGREEGHGRLMLVLTLVGTVATVLSVLVALGIGPLDVTSDGGSGGGANHPRAGGDSSPRDNGGPAQTGAAYVETVNRICGDKIDDITRRVTELNQAVADQDLNAVGLSLSQASTELAALTTRIKGVALPTDPNEARPLREWRDLYQANAEAMSKASSEWQDGSYEVASATLESAPSAAADAKGDEVRISCP
ncbi:iron-sulfur cluster assembly scaffold protein [Embleya sp. NPDC050493]|uniref:iron-sulfur cluster assembly scaffold protein n=1 Tax=Embleya sp. NPDC050493 TaxID=3363989 RepID=UPI00379B0B07